MAERSSSRATTAPKPERARRRKSRMPIGPDVPCRYATTDRKGRARMCPERGTTGRDIDGVWLLFCLTHAIATDKETEAAARAAAEKGGAS